MNRGIEILMSGALAAWAMAGCSTAAEPSLPEPQSITSGVEELSPTGTLEAGATSTRVLAVATSMKVRLDAFADGGAIPDRYTCSGENASPAVSWSGVPANAQSLVLIVYDADAGPALGPGTDLGFIHWLVYDLLPTTPGLPAGATRDAKALAGGVEAPNDFHASAGATFPGGAVIRGAGYDGPCPPEEHAYVFRLLALDELLGLPAGTSAQSVMDALAGHVVAAADWTGTYAPAQ
jgi:Raf kinase inhibitor-like YbhB/YbcL family protein